VPNQIKIWVAQAGLLKGYRVITKSGFGIVEKQSPNKGSS